MDNIANQLIELKEIKKELETNINDLGGNITDSTIFKEYSTELKQFYKNAPKVAGEGNKVTLENTRKGKMVITVKGNTPQDEEPNPDFLKQIKKVTGKNNVRIRGKNLVNISDTENRFSGGYPTTASGTTKIWSMWTVSSGYTTQIVPIDASKKKVSVNKQYLFLIFYSKKPVLANLSQGNTIYGENGEMIENVTSTLVTTNGSNIDIPANAKYMCVASNNWNNIQVEYGSEITSYEPYIEPIEKELNLGNIELCKIDSCQDVIFKNEPANENYDNTLVEGGWYKKNAINKTIFDGSTNEKWGISPTPLTNTISFYIINNEYNILSEKIKCNNFISKSYYYIISKLDDPFITQVLGNQFIIRINKSDLSTEDVAGFKDWLALHNTVVYYVLKTPTYTQITENILINQLENLYRTIIPGGTIIIETESEEESVQLIVEATALKSWESAENESGINRNLSLKLSDSNSILNKEELEENEYVTEIEAIKNIENEEVEQLK